MKECVLSLAPEPSPQRNKILLGLNFYGYDFSTSDMEGIVGVCISLYTTIVRVYILSSTSTMLAFAIMELLTLDLS